MTLLVLGGCAGSNPRRDRIADSNGPTESLPPALADSDTGKRDTAELLAVAHATFLDESDDQPDSDPDSLSPVEIVEAPEPALDDTTDESAPELVSDPVAMIDVVSSIHSTFPLLEAAYQESQVALGNQVAAWGAFDTKLKAESMNGALGFYETYRNGGGVSKPIYGGGEWFGGYRIGRGSFQPWYQERQTNDGGELKAGFRVPLIRDRQIDARRAELWRATYERQRVEPEIRAQLILFVLDGSIAYWDWVAAGRKYQVGRRVLELAQQRNAQLERKVDVGDVDPPVLKDNLRAIASRESQLIDRRRKLQQSAIKLSLFYRTPDGQPVIPDDQLLPDFPPPHAVDPSQKVQDTVNAIASRPELVAIAAQQRRVRVDLAEARNDMLPSVDAQVVGSQDLGPPTSSKRDKSEFELEAGVVFDVPVQRRKGIGKSRAAVAKLAQLEAKRQFTEDKIRTEVDVAYAALVAAYERYGKAKESRELADYMSEVEGRKFELGQSDLLSVALREGLAVEAADSEIDALQEYFSARAFYDAALARDWPVDQTRR